MSQEMLSIDLSVEQTTLRAPGAGQSTTVLGAAEPEILTVGTTCWSCSVDCASTDTCVEDCGSGACTDDGCTS
jgi:hypothetical protein